MTGLLSSSFPIIYAVPVRNVWLELAWNFKLTY